MEAIVFAADPITWKSQDPVWVEQWPLTKEKLLAAKVFPSEPPGKPGENRILLTVPQGN